MSMPNVRMFLVGEEEGTFTIRFSTKEPGRAGWHWARHKDMGWVLVWVYPPKFKFVKDVTFGLTTKGPGGLYRRIDSYLQFVPVEVPESKEGIPSPGHVSKGPTLRMLAMKGLAVP
jgi:hypothetical protein